MSIQDQVDKIRKMPKSDLDDVLVDLLDDNHKANAVLSALHRKLDDLERHIAEQIGVCNYTAMKIVERFGRLQQAKAAFPPEPPASDTPQA